MSDFQAGKEELKSFADDVSEQINDVEQLLLDWNSDAADPATVDKVFRFFHNVKGTAGMFSLDLIQELFHVGEGVLTVFREKKTKPSPETVETILACIDELKRIFSRVVAEGREPSEKPYDLLARLAHARKTALEGGSDASAAESKGGKTADKKGADESIRISSEDATELVEIVSAFIQLQNRLDASLGSSSDSFAIKNDIRRFSSRLQNFVLSIRLAPIQPLLSGLQRVALQAARETSKSVRVQILGGDTQLDRRVLDLLRDPLIHMVRNAVDHGLEKPEDREANKKPTSGLIVVEAFQQAGQVIVSMADDGKGIDVNRVKAKALEKGLVTQAAVDQMAPADLVNFIFLPGFSTASSVTSLSGRGVGMDAVKSAVETIGGTVKVTTELGRGTKVTLTLPLTLAIVKSLSFGIGRQLYAVPQVNVEEVITEVMALAQGQLAELEGGVKMLHLRRAVIPVVSMSALLKVKPKSPFTVFVVVKHRGERFALEVDRIAGTRDFVSQPMPEIYSSIDVIGGVNQLNSGEYISLLDLTAISRIVESSNQGPSGRDNGKAAQVAQSDIFRSQQKLVFFKSGKRFAMAVQAVQQVVQVPRKAIDGVGEKIYLTFNGKTYPILRFWDHFGGGPLQRRDTYYVLLVHREGHHAAVLCEDFYGIHRLPSEFEVLIKSEGILGSTNFNSETYLVPNIFKVFELEFPSDFKSVQRKGSSFSVLIVEDDPFFATSLSDFMRSHGLSPMVARDGLHAKELLEHSLVEDSGIPGFNYIVTDFEMPNMNGMELLGWLKGHPTLQNTPVGMCTAVGDSMTRREAEKLGVEFFSGKMKYEDILVYLKRRQKESEIGIVKEVIEEHVHALSGEQQIDRRVLAFFVGGKTYGIEIDHLKEVSSVSRATQVPGAFDCVSNMIGFRGHPIPVLDLREILKRSRAKGTLQEAGFQADPEQIVAKFGDHLCALWVDRVSNVRRAKSMDRSVGITRVDKGEGGLNALAGAVLWDQNTAITLLDATKIEKMLAMIRERTKPVGQVSEGLAA